MFIQIILSEMHSPVVSWHLRSVKIQNFPARLCQAQDIFWDYNVGSVGPSAIGVMYLV